MSTVVFHIHVGLKKVKGAYSSSLIDLVTRHHLPSGITTWNKWTCLALTPARQASTGFTYSRGMEGWVDLGYMLRWFTCLQTVTHPSSNWARHRATLLIEMIVLTTTSCCHPKLGLTLILLCCGEIQTCLSVALLAPKSQKTWQDPDVVYFLFWQAVNDTLNLLEQCFTPTLFWPRKDRWLVCGWPRIGTRSWRRLMSLRLTLKPALRQSCRQRLPFCLAFVCFCLCGGNLTSGDVAMGLPGWPQTWKPWNTQGFLWTWKTQGILCNLKEKL